MNKRFQPQYLPHNDDAHALIEALAMELGLSRFLPKQKTAKPI